MTTEFYIDAADRKRIATKWVEITLWALHIWASVLVIAAPWFSAEIAAVLAGMFATVVTGIGLTLALLLLDRAADFVLNKLASIVSSPATPQAAVTRTVTETVTPVPAAPLTEIPGDATINVAGNASVQDSKPTQF